MRAVFEFRSHPWREVVASATGSASAIKLNRRGVSQHWQSQWHTTQRLVIFVLAILLVSGPVEQIIEIGW
jgi:hypothetical protein